MMRRRRTALLVSAAIAVSLSPFEVAGAGSARTAAPVARFDVEQECPTDGAGDLAPQVVSTEPFFGDVVKLDVLLLLDGITKTEAKPIVAGATEAYKTLGVSFVPTFKRIVIPPDGVAADDQPTGEFDYLFREMRGRYPSVPEGKDLVHLLTAKDVVGASDPDRGGDDQLGGAASCVGGIRVDGEEYSLSEARFRFAEVNDPEDDAHAILLAHEVGHLLGAHHHYGNCHEGRTVPPGARGSCTVMFPVAVLNSAKFGTLEGRVIRGYATSYAVD